MTTSVTVLIATRNGGQWIGECLDSFCQLESPPGGYKLVIVDNGSTDNTSETVQSFRERLPITLLYEPKPGKNRALNLALDHIVGDLAVFTDDDVIVSPDWLMQMRQLADNHPDFDLFGGRIEPAWQRTPPKWLQTTVDHAMVYAVTAPDRLDGETSPGSIFGANMAMRAKWFQEGIRFSETIGPDGTSNYAMGSETSLLRSLSDKGALAWFSSNCRVKHIIREYQLTFTWVFKRYYRSGRSLGRILRSKKYDGAYLFGIQRYLISMYINELFLSMLYLIKLNYRKSLIHLFESNKIKGIISEQM